MPQARQWSAGAIPRRFSSRIALPRRSATPRSSAEQRRRQRIAGLAAQVDDAHRRQVGAEPAAERQALERRPALGARRRRPEDRDGALERRALDGDRAGVVARVGVLLVRRVVLLVDDDQAEARARARRRRSVPPRRSGPRRSTMRARSSRRSASVSAEWRIATRSPNRARNAADGLRRQRDLGHEDDRAEPALEHRGAGLEVHLGLRRSGRAVQQEVAAARVDRGDDPRRPRRPAAATRPVRPTRRRAPASRRAAPAPCGASASPARRARAPGPASSRSSRRATAPARRARAEPGRSRSRSA